jgi:antitoxin (DNA-binding transcriptional repressor) of toxin-antitoxin stability system
MNERVVNIYEAKTKLSQLLKLVTEGEQVVIAKAGQLQGDLGSLRGRLSLRLTLMSPSLRSSSSALRERSEALTRHSHLFMGCHKSPTTYARAQTKHHRGARGVCEQRECLGAVD